MTSRAEPDNYVPALAYRWLTPLYDPLVAFTTRERAFKDALLRQAAIAGRMQVLDLACGTGTLAIAAKKQHAEATVHGLDGDPQILARARAKAAAASAEIHLTEGLSFDLPYADGRFDRVLSSLFFHHLVHDDKIRTLAEVHRVLRADGELHIADWGEPGNPLMRALSKGIEVLDGREQTADNLAGRLPSMVASAGFADVRQGPSFQTPFGVLRLLSAQR